MLGNNTHYDILGQFERWTNFEKAVNATNKKMWLKQAALRYDDYERG